MLRFSTLLILTLSGRCSRIASVPCKRGKVLEKMLFMGEGYLLNLDGTGYFSSNNRYSPACLETKSRMAR